MLAGNLSWAQWARAALIALGIVVAVAIIGFFVLKGFLDTIPENTVPIPPQGGGTFFIHKN